MSVPGLAKRLKQAREKLYESPARAAEGSAIRERTIYKVETGEIANPGSELLLALCRHYRVSPDWVLGLSKRKQTR